MIYLHCRLYPGGAANVLYDLIRDDIHTGKADPENIYILTTISDQTEVALDIGTESPQIIYISVITTLPRYICNFFNFVQKKQIPVLKSLLDHRNLIIFAPELISHMSQQLHAMKPTHVTVSSFAWCKNVTIPESVEHSTLYLHSPMQYIHSHAQEYDAKITGPKGRLRGIVKHRLKRRDSLQLPGYDTMYANSIYTAQLARDIYTRECEVTYPQIHIGEVLSKDDILSRIGDSEISILCSQLLDADQGYYIYIGRVVKFVKEIDRIVKLFNHTGDQLLIIGDGPDMAEMQALSNKNINKDSLVNKHTTQGNKTQGEVLNNLYFSSENSYTKNKVGKQNQLTKKTFSGKKTPNIHYLGRIQDLDIKTSLLAHSQGLINITKESYGLVTAEAIQLGVPVFGYNQGGSVELVTEGKGMLVDSKEHEDLVSNWKEFIQD